jgi:hypothetical protein
MSQQLHWLAPLRVASAAARVAVLAQHARPAICFWIPRVTPLSISFLQAPLPTALLLLGRAHHAVTSKLAARKFSGRL